MVLACTCRTPCAWLTCSWRSAREFAAVVAALLSRPATEVVAREDQAVVEAHVT
jgi:hypothetical protein